MATLKTNTLTGTSTAGSIAVTGEGNSTTTNLQQGLAKAWVNFDGTASGAAARDSFNVSGMTDNGTGDYTVSINNDMANVNYASSCSGGHTLTGRYNLIADADGKATGSAGFFGFQTSTGGDLDHAEVSVSFFGDLA